MLGYLEVGGANEFEHHVEGPEVTYVLDGHDLARPEIVQCLDVCSLTNDCRHVRTTTSCNLNSGRADATRRSGDEYAVAGAYGRLHHEGVVGGRKCLGEASRVRVVDVLWDGQEMGCGHHDMCCLPATANDCADALVTPLFVNAVTEGFDNAHGFESWYVARRVRRRGVEPATLQKVGGIDARGSDSESYLSWPRGRGESLLHVKGGIGNDYGAHVLNLSVVATDATVQ